MNNVRRTVLFFVDDYSGGAGNVVQILANELNQDSRYVPVIVILNPHTTKNKLSPDIKVIELPLYKNYSKNRLINLWRNIISIRRIVKLVSPDIIISFINNTNILVCLSLIWNHKIPIIVSERSNPLVMLPSGKMRMFYRFAYRRADLISVQCAYFSNFIPSLSKKIIVTPNPIQSTVYMKHNYNFGKTIRLVTCARLHPIKQLDLMIDVFDAINKKYPNSSLTIYGEGQDRARLESIIKYKHLETVVSMPGAFKDVHQIISDYDIYIMTSKQEGFPNAMCEAMAVGLPVVAFMCHDGLKEIIRNDVNGFLIPRYDVKMMCDCLENLINNSTLRENIGQNAKLVSQTFSTSRIAGLWIHYINTLVS